MTGCDALVASVQAENTMGWSCRAVSEDTVLLVSPFHYSDGDAVEVMVRTVDDEVIVHDGGEILARLDSAGVRLDTGRLRMTWTRLLRAHAVDHHHGLIMRRARAAQAAQTVHDMIEALANIDGLRLLIPPPRPLPFPDRLVTLLEAEFPEVERRVRITGDSGLSYQLTAAAGLGDRLVYIQAAAGGSAQAQRGAVEHAYTAFSDIDGALPIDRKLVVLDDEGPSWASPQVKLLTRVAYVGTWSGRDRWIEFVRGTVPKDSRLLTDAQQLPLAEH